MPAPNFHSVILRFRQNCSGSMMIVFAMASMLLLSLVGAAVDYGRTFAASSQAQNILDAAALAGGRTYQVTRKTTDATAAAKTYFDQMAAGKANWSLTFNSVNIAKRNLTLKAKITTKTPFLGLMGFRDITVEKASVAQLAEGSESPVSYEISIMADLTGSMGGTKIADLKVAVKDLIDIIVWEDQSVKYSKIAIAPFSDAVRPGADYLDQVSANGASTHRFQDNEGRWQRYSRTDCVSERNGDAAYTDAAPTGNDRVGPVYTRSGNCNPGSPVIPLTNDKVALKAAVDNFTTGGYTAGHIGTAWAWYLISPNWASIWPAGSKPAPYNRSEVRKIAILMTDGEYNTQYDDAGIQTREHGQGHMNGLSDAQARQICDNMKAAGVEVYTVGFALKDAKANETMRLCATDSSHNFNAANGDELKAAFRSIALYLAQLRLSN